jgi:hypothetical protein
MAMGNSLALCAVLAAAITVLGLTGDAWAAPVLTIEPSSAVYSPGGFVDFDVRLTGAIGLALYNIDIRIQDTAGSLPGGFSNNNYWLEDLLPADTLNIATRPAGSGYIFNLNADTTTRATGIFINLDGSNYGINLSDYDDTFTGRNTDPGQQVLGTFRVQTGTAFHGTLKLSFDTSTLALDDPSVVPTSIAGFAQGNYSSSATLTPEPATAGLLVTGLTGWFLARRRRASAGTPA